MGDQLRGALDGFDEARAHAALDRLLSTFTLETVLRDAVLPYLRELGERWERGEASIAQEHFASVLLRGRLLGLARGWGSGGSRLALLACLPGEQHDLGLICFGLALRGQGWRIIFLGTRHAARHDHRDHAHAAARAGRRDRDDKRARRNAGTASPRSARSAPLALAGAGTEAGARRGRRRRLSRRRSCQRRDPHSRSRAGGALEHVMARPALTGWSSTERKSPDGAVQFEQRVSATRPLVELTERGALALGERYWQEVEACTHGLVRARAEAAGIELRLLGRWPLLRFGAPQALVDASGVLCRFPITGGLPRALGRRVDHVRAGGRAGNRTARDDRRLLPTSQRAALPARAAAHPHEHQPPLLRRLIAEGPR